MIGSRYATALLGCSLVVAVARLAALAQDIGPPISINTCAPLLAPNAAPSSSPSFMGIPIGSFTSTSTGMHIAFVNNGPKVAKLVNFSVDSNGNTFVIRDVGTFSPGILIDHQYRNGAGQGFVLPAFIAPNVTCSVSSVAYVDGSLWRHGQPPNVVPVALPSPAQPGLTVSPANVTLNSRSDSALFLVQAATRLADLKETDNCTGVASVFVGSVADRAASYYVRPIAPGTCAAHVIDDTGATVSIPITVH